jgi:hypothetical protein
MSGKQTLAIGYRTTAASGESANLQIVLDEFSIAAQLDELASTSGDLRFRAAAAVLRAPASSGRPAVKDEASLSEIERLIAAGTKPNRAYHQVARGLARGASEGSKVPKVDSIVRRRMRKRLALARKNH